MASLNQLGYTVINRADQPFNHEVFERVKASIRFVGAKYLRQRINKEYNKDQYLHTFDVTLVKVPTIESCILPENPDADCIRLRSENKIPSIIDFAGYMPFTYVGTLDGNVFTYCKPHEVKFYTALRFANKLIYTIENGYIVLYGNTKLKYARAIAPFSNIEQVLASCSTGNCYNDDMEFFIPEDLVSDVLTEVTKLEFPITVDDNTVTINEVI